MASQDTARKARPSSSFASKARRQRTLEAYLFLLPALALIVTLTTEYHHLIWRTVSFYSMGNFLALKVTYGPFFWVAWSYNLILLLTGAIILIRDNLNHFHLYRWQVAWIGAGLLIVVGFNVIYIARVFPWLQKDESQYWPAVEV